MDIGSYSTHRMIWTSRMISDKSYRDSFILCLLTKLFLNSLLPKFFWQNFCFVTQRCAIQHRTKKEKIDTRYLLSSFIATLYWIIFISYFSGGETSESLSQKCVNQHVKNLWSPYSRNMVKAHNPLFQKNTPAVNTLFCSNYLGRVCLPVTVASCTPNEHQLYVCFQIRTASGRTILHPDAFHELNVNVNMNEGNTVQLLGKSLSIHNMLSNDGYIISIFLLDARGSRFT
jgi:hypothetical protein